MTRYVMSAEENYDAAHITAIAALTTYTDTYLNTDQNYQGVQWDAVRRNLMYIYTENIPTSPTTNTTGFNLWDGATVIAPDDAVDPATQFNTSVAVKNIDTGDVSFFLSYNSANLVPSGIGGSDGTYRRYTQDFSASPRITLRNGPGMTDPYTGNYWVNSESCELYCFRLQDDYSQVISPLFPVTNPNDIMQVVGFTDTGASGPWTFAREIHRLTATTMDVTLYLTPREFTSTEIADDYILPYATFLYPNWPGKDTLFRAYNREIFDHAGNMYLFTCASSGGKAFKLYKFSLPTSAPYGGPTVGGGFTEITPWGVSTGPNADGPTYTLLRTSGTTVETSDIIPMYLPATDDLVLIEKFFPIEKTALSYDPALMFWSCTYVHAPAGTPTYDHHSAFVTGYMTATWEPTDITGAAYAVSDAFEVNSYLGQSDYLYDIDYTTRWFFFVCSKMTAGVSDNIPRIVLVNYRFVYGSAPSVVTIIDEQGWDDAYPAYAPKSADVYQPYGTVDTPAVAVSMTTIFGNSKYCPLWDVGIYDPVTNSFWWSGAATDSTQTTALFGSFNAAFADRMQQSDGTPGGTNIAAAPPFLKLTFAESTAAGQVYAQVLSSRVQPCSGTVGY